MRFRSVLLAAGRGTRLRPLTDVLPKPAVPVLDIPLAAYSLDRLMESHGPVAVNASHLSGELVRQLRPYADDRVEFVVEEPQPDGTAGTLHALRDRLADTFVVRNADSLTDLDLRALEDAHRENDAAATVAVGIVDRGADFQLGPAGEVEFVDRRERPDAPGMLYLGSAVFDRSALSLLPDRRPLDLGRFLLLPLATDGRLALHVHAGYWRDVGRVGDYVDASVDVLEGRGPRPPRAPRGEIVETVGGRAYVGAGCDHSAGELGPGAILLEGSSLGAGALVRNAVVWPGESVPAGVSLEHCVWALGRALSAGGPGSEG